MSKKDQLQLQGVCENNLKNLNLTIDHDQLIAVTGVSGSGKTSLAFDTIYAEGGRRYIETFSPYTRQFLDRLHQPELTSISGVRPALALEQQNRITNSRSTVGTVTEINDYLKIIWSNLASAHCPSCKREIKKYPAQEIFRELETEDFNNATLFISFEVTHLGESSFESFRNTLISQGFLRCLDSENEILKLEELPKSKTKKTKLKIISDRLSIEDGNSFLEAKERFISSSEQAYHYGKGKLSILVLDKNKNEIFSRAFSRNYSCADCQIELGEPKASLFTFNSPLGACTNCKGFGSTLTIDPELCVPNQELSIADGAVQCFELKSLGKHRRTLLKFCEEQKIKTDIAWNKLSKKQQELIFAGSGSYKGIYGAFKRLERKIYKMHVRVLLSRYRSQKLCPSCNGARLKPEALNYTVNGHSLPKIWDLNLVQAEQFFSDLEQQEKGLEVVSTAISEVLSRLRYLVEIGLPYLTLSRQSRTLSGGESQRVGLTTILGSRLVNTTLVLDEPTIGLHQRDTFRLVNTLKNLRDRGNTVIVVEHDQQVIKEMDHIIDLGPLSGSGGGEIVYQGDLPEFFKCKNSLTAKYLNEAVRLKEEVSRLTAKKISIKNASANNLKNISVDIPLNQLVVLSGVSGSGKSTLIQDCLIEPYKRLQLGGKVDSLKGLEQLSEVVLIDQSPVGKTPRSNPATYTKAWEPIRECFAETTGAERLGLSKSSFSFNVDGGRCPDCKGSGYHKVEMQFLADVFVECERCGGSRFQEKVLGVTLNGKNITDILKMTLDDASAFFQDIGNEKRTKAITTALQPLLDLGLGYLKLGQPLSKISGGEAQRIKLASYLSERKKDKGVLFVLDEPTTGLHPHNIQSLLTTFERLLENGHSIFCVEHNLDVIAKADWLIDLGPEGGDGGGKIVFEGSLGDLDFRSPKLAKKYNKSNTLQCLGSSASPQMGLGKSEKLASTEALKPKSEQIRIIGAKEHNLRNISVDIQKNKITVVTGVSGSGKSTLIFDILFSEGQRRFIDCLSPYARQYIKQLKRAEVDLVDSIPPTIAVSQKTAPPMGISTVATTTEIYQFLRLLFAKAGTQHCPKHDLPITSLTTEEIAKEIATRFGKERIFLFAPAVSGRKGYYNDLFIRALKAEIEEARIDDKIVSLSPELRLERHKLHWISLLVASINKPKADSEILKAAIEQCLLLGQGSIELTVGAKSGKPILFSTERVCPKCKTGFRQLDPQDFSFRSKRGVCLKCEGRGVIESSSRIEQTCPSCNGTRIAEIGRHVYIANKNIHEFANNTAPQLLKLIDNLNLSPRLAPVVTPLISELTHRLKLISDIGLDYLSLDRSASSISGGEAQRLRLAKTLGSPLTGVCYILDEPTIGLHPSDHRELLNTLFALRDSGNTVIVVEHDPDTILAGDQVIDIGPGGGEHGGELVSVGTVKDLLKNPFSKTGQALSKRLNEADERFSNQKRIGECIEITEATKNNLKSVDFKIPLQQLTVVCGVSGAGKSSLVHGVLVPALQEKLSKTKVKNHFRHWKEIRGHESINRFAEIDQSPVGKSSASCPATYLGILDEIRKIFALVPEAKARGLKQNYFSFNSGKGRCEACSGKGFIKVPMSFLPDAISECEICLGLRFNDSALEIEFQGRSLGEILKLTMSNAKEIFANHKKVRRALEYVDDLGIGYLTLGQPTHTLSGGEAQRLKIARELSSAEAKDTLYVMDEPTVGLHMTDVDKLLNVLNKLVEKGNTVVVIEHNTDVIRKADYLIEIGPKAGEQGGKLLFQGHPSELKSNKLQTPTKNYLAQQNQTKPLALHAHVA